MFVDHFRGTHVTRNKRNGVWRYTYRFKNGVVFHTSYSKHTRKQLRDIENGTYILNNEFRETYSVGP